MAINKKYVKIGIAGVAVTALVIGLSVGLSTSKKNKTASSASKNNGVGWDATKQEECVAGKSGKSGAAPVGRRLVVPGTEDYSAGSGKPGQLRNDLVRELEKTTKAPKAAKANLPICPPKNSDICVGPYPYGKAGKSGGSGGTGGAGKSGKSGYFYDYDWSDLGDNEGDKLYACPVGKSGKSGGSGAPGAGKTGKSGGTRRLETSQPTGKAGKSTPGVPSCGKSGKSGAAPGTGTAEPCPTPAPTTCDDTICTCPFPKWTLNDVSKKCQRTVECADDETDYLVGEYKNATECCAEQGITDADCMTRTYDVCEDCCDCEQQPWVKVDGQCLRSCAISCDAFELDGKTCDEYKTEVACCDSVGCGFAGDYCDTPTLAPTTDPIATPTTDPIATPTTDPVAATSNAPSIKKLPCICEAEPWVFNGSECIRGCNTCENGGPSAGFTCTVYSSQAQCCNENFDGLKNCGTDTCPAGLPETVRPTPSPTQGSTPTVSTEVTGPPTLPDRVPFN